MHVVYEYIITPMSEPTLYSPSANRIVELEDKLQNAEEHRDEFLASRNRYANIAHQLAEYITGNGKCPYPHEALKQIEIAKGKHGYKWPSHEVR